MANPYEKYAKPKENPYQKYAPEDTLIDQAGRAAKDVVKIGGRGFANIPIGAMQLPGFPVEAIFSGGNFLRRQLDLPETQLQDSVAKDWGAEGWRRFFEGHVGKANIPAPTNEIERIADKTGQFVGGGLPFGPAGLVPSLTATAGSEVGRATDQAGLTGGYGETVGAVVGGAGPGLVRGQSTAGIRNAPTVEAIRKAKDAAYKAAEREGVIYTPQFLNRLNERVKQFAADRAYAHENQPGITAGLRGLQESVDSGANATLTHVDQVLRKRFGDAGGDFTRPSQQSMAAEIKSLIDEALDPANLQAGDVLAGNGARAAELITKARGLNQRMRLAERIDEALYQAENNAATSGVGGNLDNAMRQKIKAILNNPKRRASFSKPEREMMEKIVRGSWSQNKMRQIGGFAPGRGFLPAALLGHLGLTAVGAGVPAAATLPLALAYTGVTSGAKNLAEGLTRRNIDRLNAAVRGGRQVAQKTNRQRANDILLELRRRAELAGTSAAPGLIGATNQR